VPNGLDTCRIVNEKSTSCHGGALLAHAALHRALQRVAAPLSAHNAFLKDVPMLKRILVAFLAFLAFSVFAADANTASQADLEAIKGIGPAIATKIIDER
jgi:DNA uptake protein ComE-like DNA-binding protein